MSEPLLMIPGPIEVSPAVREAFGAKPPSHVSPPVIEAFGASVELMRHVWCAGPDAQPFILAGSGTIAMDMGVCNVVDSGDDVLVINTGYFSDRVAEMVRRRGANVTQLAAASVGEAPSAEEVAAALDAKSYKALVSTHVDTSTGVRIDAEGYARAAHARGVLSVFDGVCATVAETFRMAEWNADIYLTASQKAIGLPPGLALLVASPAALEARRNLKTPPPMSIDFESWIPIMKAYEERRPSYFSTPATNLILALAVGLQELIGDRGAAGMEAVFARHARAADAMRAAWRALGMDILPKSDALAANTLSAVCYPDGVSPALVGSIKAHGAIVAGGLLPGWKEKYFRVGHMGWVTTEPELLLRTVDAIEGALIDQGHAVTPGTGRAAAAAILG